MIDASRVDDLQHAKVVDSDGAKLGTVSEVYVDETDGRPLFATIHSGLFGSNESFVPLQHATLDARVLRVAYRRATIANAPTIANDGAIDASQQDRILAYYAGGAAPSPDDGMIRSEERLNVGTERVESGRVRLRKHVVTEQQTVTVLFGHDEVRLVREPITAENGEGAFDNPVLAEAVFEIVLMEERPLVTKETVPVERVRLTTESVTEAQSVTGEVRKERIELDGDGADHDDQKDVLR
jgi:uncharacterized protein (TIGR02271 family)